MSEIACRAPHTSLFYNPLEGVRYFDRFDQQLMYSFETTDPAGANMCLEYYPVVNYVRLIALSEGERLEWTHNYRLKRSEGVFNEVDSREELEALIGTWLEKEGINLQEASQGYPEIVQAVEEAKRVAPIDVTVLQPGETYLYVRTLQHDGESTDEMAVFRATDVCEEVGEAKRVVFAVGYDQKADIGMDGVVEIDAQTFEPRLPTRFISDKRAGHLACIDANPRPRVDGGAEAHNFYPFTKGNVTIINTFHRPEFDPYVLTGWTREKMSFAVTLQVLQWQRDKTIAQQNRSAGYVARLAEQHKNVIAAHGFDVVLLENLECATRDHNDSKKEATETYQTALESLLDRFGEPFFVSQALHLMTRHLHGLHTPFHNRNLTAPVCMARPLETHFLEVAEVLLDGQQFPSTMQEGSAKVIEVQALFGDPLFWQLMRNNHPDAFTALVDGYKNIGSIVQQVAKPSAEVDPVGIMRDYFPDAYQIVCQSRPDFATHLCSARRSSRQPEVLLSR